MSRRRRILFIAGGLVIAGIAGAYAYAPTYVRNRIEREHPDVKVDSVRIGWKTVTLDGVHLTRPWISGTISRAVTDWDSLWVDAVGGELTVNLDKRPKSNGDVVPEKRTIAVRGLTVHVSKGAFRADLREANYANGTFSFAASDVTHPLFSAKTGSGTASGVKGVPDAHEGVVSDVEIIPAKDLPHFTGPVKVDRLGITFSKTHFSYVNIDTADLDVVDPRGQPTHLQVVGARITIPPPDVIADGSGYMLEVAKLLVAHPWINPEQVTFKKLFVGVNPNLKIPDKIGLLIGDWDAVLSIEPKTLTFRGDETCRTWVTAFPVELRHGPLNEPTRFTGHLGFDVQLKPKPTVKIASTCKYDCSAPEIQALKRPFTYKVYNAKNERVDRVTGPGSKDWVKLDAITSNMPTAVMEMEDRAFPHHKGFIPEAFENSLDADLKAGKFVRGGSTITMQLAKNLWLRRTKTLGRKVEELLLTMALESCFTKDQLMELYLNVVEFGPDLYGVGPAAKKYFNVAPKELGPDQAFYLASLLPNPKKAPPPDVKTMARMGALMQMLVNAGRIPDSMLLDIQPTPVDTAGWQ